MTRMEGKRRSKIEDGKSCFFPIRDIRAIRSRSSSDDFKVLAQAAGELFAANGGKIEHGKAFHTKEAEVTKGKADTETLTTDYADDSDGEEARMED
jgi:hypothetical protein